MKIFIVICLLGATSAHSAETSGKWQEKMQLLATTFSEMLPELMSENGDVKTLEKKAKVLSELAHGLDMGRKTGKLVPPSDFDPSVAMLAGRFSDTAKQAYQAIHQGQVQYGKGLLRTVTSYCIACHTRHDSGPDFPFFPLEVKTEKLQPSERALLYLSTRQFDKGLDELNGLIDNETIVKTQPFAWGKYLRQALSVTVRVKQDPFLTEKLVQKALGVKSIPEFERDSLLKWQAAVENWKKENKLKLHTEKEKMKEITRLTHTAKQAQTSVFDHGGEVEFLRASALAHDVLRTSKDPKVKAEAFFVIGSSYESLGIPNFWPMHELWYEACVHEVPHSQLALRCYNHLEESVYFGYTGSAGTNIPSDVEANLKKVKELALPDNAIKNKK